MIGVVENNCENGHEILQNTDEQSSNNKGPIFRTEITVEVNRSDESSEGNDELLIFKDDDQKTVINKSAYSKLHRLSKASENRLSVASLSKFESSSDLNQNQSSFKPNLKIFLPKTENIGLTNSPAKTSDDEAIDFVPCIIRKSESVETVDRIEKELSNFIMDNNKKTKKRTNSFRKLFSVSFFGKDKKKKEKEAALITQSNSDCVDNYQNETNCNSFVRNTPQRHTVSCDHFKYKTNYGGKPSDLSKNIEEDPPPEIMRQYANTHIQKFNRIRHSFESPEDRKFNEKPIEDFIPNPIQNLGSSDITKYIDTSSSASTMESEKRNTYQNALIAQAELQKSREEKGIKPILEYKSKLTREDSLRRETPPRAQDTYQPVNIVKPKARLPINSGRPLPNPYQFEAVDKIISEQPNMSSHENKELPSTKFNEIYGTVFDAIPSNNLRNRKLVNSSQDSRMTPSPIPISPKSPSLEMSKLRLPPNRKIVPLQPRVRSPLPSMKVSSEKLIATELLKTASPTNTDRKIKPASLELVQETHHSDKFHMIPNAESTPENVSKAINALRNELEVNEQNLKQELVQIKSTLNNLTQNNTLERNKPPNVSNHREDVLYDTNSPRGTLISSRSSITMSPISQTFSPDGMRSSPSLRHTSRPSPEVELRQKNSLGRTVASQSYSPASPSKDEIRRSVEAYYWKEIKRIKEQEDYDIYLSHLHYSREGYAEDPTCSRRSREVDGSRGRRSLSVPRNPRQLSFDGRNDPNLRPFEIPKGSTVVYGPQGNDVYGYFMGTSGIRLPPRESVSNSNRQTNEEYGTYKPIFRRGSLSGNVPQPVQLNKKVSFSNSQQLAAVEGWPTKNGFTKSPPQRRMERMVDNNIEDDVFLPTVAHQANIQIQPIYGTHQKPPIRNNYNSDHEGVYGTRQSTNMNGYAAGRIPISRNTNYNSDSEAIYGRQRRYKTMSQQDLENLRNAQLRGSLRPNYVEPKPPQRLTRHESIQLPGPSYGYAVQYGRNKRGSYQSNSNMENYTPTNQSRISQNPPRRDILITDNIYGQHMGYYNDSVGSLYGYSLSNNQNMVEPVYISRPKEVTVRNKVCDIYGKIHDAQGMQGEIQATGVLMGQLQESPITSPTNFRRGTRLTASNNDMLLRRRPGNVQQYELESDKTSQPNVRGAPVRPLPPLPPNGRSTLNENSKKLNPKKNQTNSTRKKKK